MTTTDKSISDSVARSEIAQLIARYCHYVRTRQVDKILGLYTPDGVFDMPANMRPGGVRSGRAMIEETFRDNLESMDPWPFTHNHVIEIDSEDHAHGFVYTEFRLGSEDMRLGFIGCYDDHYRKEGGTWKFQSRVLNAVSVP